MANSITLKEIAQAFPSEFNKFNKELKALFSGKQNIGIEEVDTFLSKIPKGKFDVDYTVYSGDAQKTRKDVKQLVMQVNKGNSLNDIQDPELSKFIKDIIEISYRSGHPVKKEHTLGWFRIDVIDNNLLLVDEVQSDIFEALSKFVKGGEGLPAELREKYPPDKMKAYTKELQKIIGDWHIEGLSTILAFARANGIQKVALHTEASTALKGDSASFVYEYYYQLAKKMGFGEENIEIPGRGTHTFYTREARRIASKFLEGMRGVLPNVGTFVIKTVKEVGTISRYLVEYANGTTAWVSESIISMANFDKPTYAKRRSGMKTADHIFSPNNEGSDTTKVYNEPVEIDELEEPTSHATISEGSEQFVNCPATHENVEVYKNICQEWNKIDLCSGPICSFYPVVNRAPNLTVDLEPKKKASMTITSDAEPNILDVHGEQIEVKGHTFADKLRNLRNTLVEKIGVDKAKEFIGRIVGERKVASANIVKIAGETIRKDASYFIIARNTTSPTNTNVGIVKNIKQYKDGSMMIVAQNGDETFETTASMIIKIASICANYRKDDETCKINCPKQGIIAGQVCPFYPEEQTECPCYR